MQYLGYITYSHLSYKKKNKIKNKKESYNTYNTLLTVTSLLYTLPYLQYITHNSLINVHVTEKKLIQSKKKNASSPNWFLSYFGKMEFQRVL